jgi:hypothetical protein
MKTITKSLLATSLIAISGTAFATPTISISFIEAVGDEKATYIDPEQIDYSTSADDLSQVLVDRGLEVKRHGIQIPFPTDAESEVIDRTSIRAIGSKEYTEGMVYRLNFEAKNEIAEGLYGIGYNIVEFGNTTVQVSDELLGQINVVSSVSSDTDGVLLYHEDESLGHIDSYSIQGLDDDLQPFTKKVYVAINIE